MLMSSVQGKNQSELFFGSGCYAEDLDPDDEIIVKWLPNRQCVFRYLGNSKFVVVESKNSQLDVGDTFSCEAFIENEVLNVHKLSHGGKENLCYRAGLDKGIKFSVKEKNEELAEGDIQENGGGKIKLLVLQNSMYFSILM